MRQASRSTVAEARTVWITRAAPGAKRTAERVAALGWRPLVAPLLVVRPVKATLNLERHEALAFTSSQALHHLDPATPRDAVVFAVGDATAEAARAAGFTNVRSAAGDVEALAALIVRNRPAAVVHPAAKRTAGDLVRRLTDAGLPARRVIVYRAEACRAPPPAATEALNAGALAAVLIHSPRAGQVAAALIARAGMDVSAAVALGLSLACIEPLAHAGFGDLQAAAAPQEAALLDLLSSIDGEGAP
jgi:uroporphyrinogen-III synthase